MPSGSSGLFNKRRFSDGEGLVHTDLNDLSHMLDSRRLGTDFWNARALGRAQSVNTFQHGNVRGVSLHGSGVQESGLLSSRLYVPWPYDGVIRPQAAASAVDPAELFVENGVLVYLENNNMQGTAPDEFGEVAVVTLRDTDHDLGANITGNPAPGAGNPRWDTLGVRLNFETSDSQTRDFKDAVTGALSTQSQDKAFKLFTDYEYTVGVQSGGYSPSAFATAGQVPLLTIRRPVGEGATLDPDDFYYHAYPLRLGVEDIPGYELLPAIGTWGVDTQGQGSLQKSGSGPGSVLAIPRQIHSGCRIVGVGVLGGDWGNDAKVELGLWSYATTGVPVFTSRVDLGSATGIGPITGTQDGFQAAGEGDWSSGVPFPLPIWGNGHHRGPLFVTHAQAYTSSSPFDKVALRLQERQLGVFEWADLAKIYLVRFYYLF